MADVLSDLEDRVTKLEHNVAGLLHMIDQNVAAAAVTYGASYKVTDALGVGIAGLSLAIALLVVVIVLAVVFAKSAKMSKGKI